MKKLLATIFLIIGQLLFFVSVAAIALFALISFNEKGFEGLALGLGLAGATAGMVLLIACARILNKNVADIIFDNLFLLLIS